MSKTEFIKETSCTKNQIFLSLYVYNIGFQKCLPQHKWEGIRNHYLIHYIHSGRGYYRTGGQTFLLTKGDAFLIYPDKKVCYYADENEPWEYYWVGFHGTDAISLIEKTDFSPQNPIFYHCSFGNEILNCLLEIYYVRGNTAANTVKMTSSLYQMFSFFIQDSTTKQIKPSSVPHIELAISFIASQYSYPITIEEIASYVGISRTHLFREFKEHLKQSPKDYLTDFRMKEACRLLNSTTLSINSIANSVGYENGMYFSKSFHKKFHITPSQFRQINSFPNF